ncbi:MAG: hypothetical protein B0D91_08405 [Oceanospirillales bacterium LUC14_002_19_P2]|nr:MAG: hypothetical protein B0D91_08405 [Oceanospirillales bacterium LUC14_002_19_P2]
MGASKRKIKRLTYISTCMRHVTIALFCLMLAAITFLLKYEPGFINNFTFFSVLWQILEFIRDSSTLVNGLIISVFIFLSLLRWIILALTIQLGY